MIPSALEFIHHGIKRLSILGNDAGTPGRSAINGLRLVANYALPLSIDSFSASDLFVGTLAMFNAAGFEEVSRIGDRPLVRRSVGSS